MANKSTYNNVKHVNSLVRPNHFVASGRESAANGSLFSWEEQIAWFQEKWGSHIESEDPACRPQSALTPTPDWLQETVKV